MRQWHSSWALPTDPTTLDFAGSEGGVSGHFVPISGVHKPDCGGRERTLLLSAGKSSDCVRDRQDCRRWWRETAKISGPSAAVDPAEPVPSRDTRRHEIDNAPAYLVGHQDIPFAGRRVAWTAIAYV